MTLGFPTNAEKNSVNMQFSSEIHLNSFTG